MNQMVEQRFLVTAGNTRERIDAVRDWGNIFTGNTGFGIARQLASCGKVTFLTSNREHLQQIQSDPLISASIDGEHFTTHAELERLLEHQMRKQTYHGVVMTAAVADYRPVRVYEIVEREIINEDADQAAYPERWIVRDVQRGKVGSNYRAIAVLGQRTEKLIDLFRTRWNHRGLLIKFKLEVDRSPDELIAIGKASRAASDADYLVANTLEMVSGEHAGAFLIGRETTEWVERERLAARLRQILAGRGAMIALPHEAIA
jgi:phosphopantothenate---cysteine ligase (CTP)